MPKMSVESLMESKGSLIKLLNAPLSIYTAFRLKEFAKAFAAKLTELEKERVALVHQYGEKDPKTGEVNVKDENMPTFNEAWAGVMAREAILPNVVVKLREIERANLSAVDLMNIEWLLDSEDLIPAGEQRLVQLPRPA